MTSELTLSSLAHLSGKPINEKPLLTIWNALNCGQCLLMPTDKREIRALMSGSLL